MQIHLYHVYPEIILPQEEKIYHTYRTIKVDKQTHERWKKAMADFVLMQIEINFFIGDTKKIF